MLRPFTILVIALITFVPQARIGLRLIGTPSPSNVLTASDLTFLGYAKDVSGNLDAADWATGASLAVRRVGGELHLFRFGGPTVGYRISELNFPLSSYTTDLNTAPASSLVATWGNCMNGVFGLSWNSDGSQVAGATWAPSDLLYWPSNNTLYFGYWDGYNTGGRPDWNIGGCTLDSISGTTGNSTTIGPFRLSPLGVQYAFFMAPDLLDSSKIMVGAGSVETGGITAPPWGLTWLCCLTPPTGSTPSGWPGAPSGSPNPDLSVSGGTYIRHYYMGSNNGDSSNHFNDDGTLTGNIKSMRRPSTNPVGEYLPHQNPPAANMNPAVNGGFGALLDWDRLNQSICIQGVHKSGCLVVGGLGGSRTENRANVTGSITTSGTGGAVSFNTADFKANNIGFRFGLVISGSWSGTIKAQSSPDNSSWSDMDIYIGTGGDQTIHYASVSSNGIYSLPWNGNYLRLYATSVSGTASIAVSNCNGHTEYISLGTLFCPDGCLFASNTGPSGSIMYPAMAIYDINDLLAVRAGSMTDYAPVPEIIDLAGTFANFSAPTMDVAKLPTARAVTGVAYDSVSKILIVPANAVDGTTDFGHYKPVYNVFSVNDSAPAPLWPVGVALIGLAFIMRRSDT